MTLEEERLYNKNAECALKSSGFELISTSPEDDYIEAYCPKCKSITVFHQDELDRARCYTCLDRLMYVQSQFVFEKKSRDSIEHSGFILEEMNYDEDFLMIRCPICGECSSYYFSELGNVCCPNCGIDHTIDEKGFLLACPVCQSTRHNENVCMQCGFDELNISFFRDAIGGEWFDDHVLPYREEYWGQLQQFEIWNSTIVKYSGSRRRVMIPYGIVAIGEEAFQFSDAYSIQLPETVKTIGREAFSWCGFLKTVSLPNGITFIGADAFKNSHSLMSISVPSSVKVIERGALKNSKYRQHQATVKIENGGRYSIINGCLIDNDGESKVIVEYLGNTEVDSYDKILPALESVDRIGSYSLSGLPTEMELIIIPSNVIEIEDAAFFNCVGLKRIVLPRSVNRMGEYVFGGRWGEHIDVFCEAERFPTGWDSKCFDSYFSVECVVSVHWKAQWRYQHGIPVIIDSN